MLRVKQWRGERGQRTTPAVTVQPRGERKPLPSRLPHLFSHHSRSLADACVTLFLYVDPAAAPLCLLSTLRSFRYVLVAVCLPRCNGLLVSLVRLRIRIQRKSAIPLSRRSCFVFHRVFLLPRFPLFPSPIARCRTSFLSLSLSMHIS